MVADYDNQQARSQPVNLGGLHHVHVAGYVGPTLPCQRCPIVDKLRWHNVQLPFYESWHAMLCYRHCLA